MKGICGRAEILVDGGRCSHDYDVLVIPILPIITAASEMQREYPTIQIWGFASCLRHRHDTLLVRAHYFGRTVRLERNRYHLISRFNPSV